jgi:hypothetical protein
MSYLKRLWNVLVFFGIWWGIPFWFTHHFNDGVCLMLLLFTWIPAGAITLYLSEDNGE